MKIDFAVSKQSTLGVEWELAVLDLATLEQVPAAQLVLERQADPVSGPIRGEYLTSMIELVSKAHDSVTGVVAELANLLAEVVEILAPHGLTVMAIGAHPFADPAKQQPVAKPQYRRVQQRNAWWGTQMAINGLHIHNGVDQRSKALPITQGMARFAPYFIALSASSPYWLGTDTGFASQRTMLFQQLPTNGLPYSMASWEEFESYATDLAAVGMIQNPSEIRWDIRPSTFGTVENRAMDSVPTLFEIGAIAALSQCLNQRMSMALETGEPIEQLPHWFMQENKWRAARYGLDAQIITPRPWERTLELRTGLLRWCDDLMPIAEELDCAPQLADCRRLVLQGPSYQRQRRVFAETGGSLEALTRSVIAETLQARANFEVRV